MRELEGEVDLEAALAALSTPERRSLELAYAALRVGGLACGAVIVDEQDAILAEGRNHAYDAPDQSDVLEGTPLAHAELNALARIATETELASATLWTTQEPCSMCTAAASFLGMGTVRYVAPDPWAIATGQSRHPGDDYGVMGPVDDDRWVITANVLFLTSIGRMRGAEHPTIARNAELEPETHRIMRRLLDAYTELPPTMGGFLSPVWSAVEAAGKERRTREGRA